MTEQTPYRIRTKIRQGRVAGKGNLTLYRAEALDGSWGTTYKRTEQAAIASFNRMSANVARLTDGRS